MSHDDYTAILSQMTPFAETMLREQGAFIPFAAVMMADKTVEYVGIDPATLPGGNPDAQAIADKLDQGLVALAHEHGLRATALFTDSRISLPESSSEKTDAITARLEHIEADSLIAIRPYLKTPGGDYEFSRLFATPGEARYLLRRH